MLKRDLVILINAIKQSSYKMSGIELKVLRSLERRAAVAPGLIVLLSPKEDAEIKRIYDKSTGFGDYERKQWI